MVFIIDTNSDSVSMRWIFMYDLADRCIRIPRSVCVRSEVDRVALDRFTLEPYLLIIT